MARFAELTGEFDAWRAEQRRLQARISRKRYGGLTWQELAKLINQLLSQSETAASWTKAKKVEASLS